jgi:hypothetical protein
MIDDARNHEREDKSRNILPMEPEIPSICLKVYHTVS